MTNLFDTITSAIDSNTLTEIGQQVWLSTEQTQDIGSGVLSTILGWLAKNANTTEGAEAITTAAQSHDSSILSDVVGSFQNGTLNMEDGSKILGHIFGSSEDTVTTTLATQSGASTDQISSMMKILAPLVLSAVNKEQSSGGLTDIVGSLTQSTKAANDNSSLPMQVVTSLLDKDGDGSIVDDLTDIATSQWWSILKKLLGGFLGGSKAA